MAVKGIVSVNGTCADCGKGAREMEPFLNPRTGQIEGRCQKCTLRKLEEEDRGWGVSFGGNADALEDLALAHDDDYGTGWR